MNYPEEMQHMRRRKLLFIAGPLLAALCAIAACGGSSHPSQILQVSKHAKQQRAYLPHNDVELNNYNTAQKLYDDPTTIVWCTTTWGNASAPLVTVPIAGKLTSSSTTFFQPEYADDSNGSDGVAVLPQRSVDGLFHPNPPQYRYGFTPGGQYVDFFNMPTFCTTQPTEFQRQATKISLTPDATLGSADATAQRQLKAGDKAGAQQTLERAVGK